MWMTVIPPFPLLLLSLLVEGPEQITAALADSWSVAAIPAWLGLAYTTLLATVLGSGIWTWLMARHPSGTVAPFSMLVPVTGLALAWLVLGEVPAPLELVGGVLVVGGVLWASRTVRAKGTPGARGGDIRLEVHEESLEHTQVVANRDHVGRGYRPPCRRGATRFRRRTNRLSRWLPPIRRPLPTNCP